MKLVIVPLALAEVRDAAEFYSKKANFELGLAFVAEFERTATLVLENPMLGAIFSWHASSLSSAPISIQRHLSGYN